MQVRQEIYFKGEDDRPDNERGNKFARVRCFTHFQFIIVNVPTSFVL